MSVAEQIAQELGVTRLTIYRHLSRTAEQETSDS